MTSDLSPRGIAVLEGVVRHFIATGQPAGSGRVAGSMRESVSSATVRNVMAELERAGYLEQPHTSAGRRPTARGYLAYAQHLMQHGELQHVDERRIRRRLTDAPSELDALLQRACAVLSEMTQQVGVVLAPPRGDNDVRRIEMVRLGERRVLVVFVTGGGLVHTQAVDLDEAASDRRLREAAEYLERRFGGKTLHDVRRRISAASKRRERSAERLALRLVRRSLSKTIDEPAVLFEGTFHLLENPELAEREALPSIFETFEEPSQLLRLLQACGNEPGPRVLIGRANLPAALGGCALVAAGYRSADRPLGAVGVLGPARMEYHRTIPMVATMARVTSDMVTRLCA